jgi:hypothetical protein
MCRGISAVADPSTVKFVVGILLAHFSERVGKPIALFWRWGNLDALRSFFNSWLLWTRYLSSRPPFPFLFAAVGRFGSDETEETRLAYICDFEILCLLYNATIRILA